MDWIDGMQRAISYVEQHLMEEIDYEQVAGQSFSSSYHFQRVFSILCGYTLGEYIRMRRMTLAGAELAGGKAKVIDVALKYGYESPDSFAKAFQKFHGITPSQARADGSILRSFSRLSVKISLEGGTKMNYRIEEKEEMILTGIKRRFSGVPGERMKQEENMYMTTRAYQYIIEGMAGNVENNYNVITNIGEDGYDFYIATLLPEFLRENLHKEYVLGEEFAKHLENIVIPKCMYAIFETERCKYPTRALPDLRKQVVSEWLPTSGYQLKNAPEVVLSHWYRGEKCKERYMELWIPVEKL